MAIRLPSLSALHIPLPRNPNSNTNPSHVQSKVLIFCTPFKRLPLRSTNLKGDKGDSFLHGTKRLRSTEEETVIPEEEYQEPSVSVPVSPSDTLSMFFQAEGTMNEAAIPTVIKALEGNEGISDLKVQVLEGIASVELTKQTTVQATGVASGLVELIQGSGFKLQTLNLSFKDDEDLVVG